MVGNISKKHNYYLYLSYRYIRSYPQALLSGSLVGQLSYLSSPAANYILPGNGDQERSLPKSTEGCLQVTVSSQQRLGIPSWMAKSNIYELLTHEEQF